MQPIRRLILKELLVLFGLLAIASAGLAWMGINRILAQQIEVRSRENLGRMASDIRKDLSDVEHVGRAAARWWQEGTLRPERIQAAETPLAALMEEFPAVANLVFVSVEGWGLSMSRLPDGLSAYHLDARSEAAQKRYLRKAGRPLADAHWEPTPYRVFQRPWFLSAKENKVSRWMEAYRFANLPTHGLTYAIPLRDAQGTFLGALCADIFLDSLSQRTWAAQPTPHSLALVSDAQGKALILPKDAPPTGAQPSAYLSLVSPDFLPLFHDLLNRWQALDRTQDLIPLRHQGKGYTCLVHTLEGVEGVAWYLSLAVPDQDYRGAADRVAFIILASGGFASLLAAWRAARMANHFSTPLESLAKAAKLLGEGAVPPQLPSRITEIETLGSALHRAGLALEKEAELRLQLQHSQRLETVGTLTGGIAHDVNNQLAAIVGQLNLGREFLPPEHPTFPRLAKAEEAAHRCAQMIKSLLRFTHQTRPEFNSVDLNDIVRHTAGLVERLLGGRIVLVLELEPALPPILGEEVSLEQVVMNLAVNARDAMPEGGILTLATASTSGNEVCLSVRDTGIGIPPELVPRIFDPFFTTKAVGKGTGLGLAMTFGIIQAHRGRIEVTSHVGQGTEFRVFLTANSSQPQTPVSPTANVDQIAPSSLQGRRILIADDEVQIRDLLAEAFRGLRAEVDTVPDGLQAWGRWQEYPYDLVVSDQRMPDMTGLELLSRIRATGSEAPFILISGYGLEGLEASTAQDLRLKIISKPFKLPNLFSEAKRLIEDR